MRIDHLNNLRALEAVLRKGGLRPAAAELGVTPAAVGQHIRNLEDYLGAALLKRHPTGSHPTAKAEKVSLALSHHMSGLAEVLDDLKTQTASDQISLSVLPSFAETWIPRHMGALFAAIPGIDLRLDASTRVVDLLDGEFDFAIRSLGNPTGQYESVCLFDDFCAPVCTPDFAERYGLSDSCTSLQDVPIAEIDTDVLGSTSELGDIFDWCERFGVEPPNPGAGQIILENSMGQKMANSGLVIFLAAVQEALSELAEGKLIMPFGPDRVIKNQYKLWLLWRKGARLSPNQKRFISWITDHAAEDRRLITQFLST